MSTNGEGSLVGLFATWRRRRAERLYAHFPAQVSRLLRIGGITKITNYAGRRRG